LRKSELNIEATLEVILFILRYFKEMPIDLYEQKKHIKQHNNIKQRMKLLVNDLYGHLEKNEKFSPGFSVELMKEKDNNSKIRGIWEHTIPWEEFFYYLIRKEFTEREQLYSFLKDTYCQCRITTAEHKKLKQAGLASKMPEDWESWKERYDYQGVNIKMAKGPENPSNTSLNITKKLFE